MIGMWAWLLQPPLLGIKVVLRLLLLALLGHRGLMVLLKSKEDLMRVLGLSLLVQRWMVPRPLGRVWMRL